jgi:hypothetical protein
MISDREFWQAANAMIKRYRDDAANEAEFRADALLTVRPAGRWSLCPPCRRNAQRTSPVRVM